KDLGTIAWNGFPMSPITVLDVDQAMPIVRLQLDDNFFRVRIARMTAAERRYVSAMADLGAGPYKSGDIAAKLGRASTSVAPVRNQLINKGLVFSLSHGITDFTVPKFDDFIRRTYPFEP